MLNIKSFPLAYHLKILYIIFKQQTERYRLQFQNNRLRLVDNQTISSFKKTVLQSSSPALDVPLMPQSPDLFVERILHHWCLPDDLDINFHMNNA